MKISVLASGSSGNCTYIGGKESGILIDAGITRRYLKEALAGMAVDPESLEGIIVTHEHEDHVKGLGAISRGLDLPVYASRPTWERMIRRVSPIRDVNIRGFEGHKPFRVGEFEIRPFSVSHDAVDPVGYTVSDGKSKIGIATDMGIISDSVRRSLADCDVLVIESNHDVELLKVGSYPLHLKRRILGDRGHLSNEASANFICEIFGGKRLKIFLAHLSRENNHPDLAMATFDSILTQNGIMVGKDIEILMTYRDASTPLISTVG